MNEYQHHYFGSLANVNKAIKQASY